MKLLLTIVLCLAFLLWGFWFAAVNERLISDRIESALDRPPFMAKTLSLKKGVFYDFSADLEIQKSGSRALLLENLNVSMNPFSLVLMKLPLTFHGNVLGGKISGEMDILKNAGSFHLRAGSLQIQDIPALKDIGLDGRGLLSGNISSTAGSGEILFSIDDLSVKNWKVGGITAPLEFFKSARAVLSVKGDVITIASFTLEGDGIYARIRGNIIQGQAELNMELMPDRAFAENTPVMLLLNNYKVSPGYYVIPIKRALTAETRP